MFLPRVVTFRCRDEEHAEAKKIVAMKSDKYTNLSHYYRVAVIKQNKREQEEIKQ